MFDYSLKSGRKRIGDGSYGGYGRSSRVQTVHGQTLKDNPVPSHTAATENRPFVRFQDTRTGAAFGLSEEMLSQGLLALGAPGGGKTTLFNWVLGPLIQSMKPNDIIIINDSKGDYLKEFGPMVPERYRYIIGFGERYRKTTNYYNIFRDLMPVGNDGRLVYTGEDCDSNAIEMADMFLDDMKSDSQPIFAEMGKDISSAVLIYLMRTYWRTEPSRLNGREFIDFFKCRTLDEIKSIFGLPYMKDQKSKLNHIARQSNQTQGVLSYVSALEKLFIGPFAQADPAKEFSMRDLISRDGPAVCFIEYDLELGNMIAPMLAMAIDQGLKYALGGRRDTRKNVYFVLDEFGLLQTKLKHMADGLNFGRSQGVKMMAGLQNISAVERVYGEAGAKELLAGFQNMVTFKLTDYDTRQFLVNRMGQNYVNESFYSQGTSANIQRQGFCVEDWDITSLRLGEGIVKLTGEKPFLFHFPPYRLRS